MAGQTDLLLARARERFVVQDYYGAVHLLESVVDSGRAFADVKPENNGLDQPYGKYEGDHPWPQLVADFIDRNGYVRYWDSTAQVPYLWNAQTHVFMSYDDTQSLKLKADFVRARGLGGMMYWEQSQDPRGELLGVLSATLQ